MKILAKNKKAMFNYELFEKFEAGIKLTGAETKSAISGQISIEQAYVMIDHHYVVWLINAHIEKYKFATYDKIDPKRSRILLLHKHQIKKINFLKKTQNYTIIPTAMYLNDTKLIKITIYLAQGKKVHDKRNALKIRDEQKKIQTFKTW